MVHFGWEGLNLLRNSGLVLKENLKFASRKNVTSKFRNTGKLIPFVFEGAKMSLKFEKSGQLAFSKSQQQLVNSGNEIQFAKTFCNLDFQLNYPNRSNCISLHNCRLQKGTKRSGNTGDNILSILLKCSRWVPLYPACKMHELYLLCISNEIWMICINISKFHVNKCFNLQRDIKASKSQ